MTDKSIDMVQYTDRKPVVSSNLLAVGWREGFEEGDPTLMEIVFHSGRVYLYYGVPQQVYLDLMAAPSKGKYFWKNIRCKTIDCSDGGIPYRYRRLE